MRLIDRRCAERRLSDLSLPALTATAAALRLARHRLSFRLRPLFPRRQFGRGRGLRWIGWSAVCV